MAHSVGWLSTAFTAWMARNCHKVCAAEDYWKGLAGSLQCFMFPDFTPQTSSQKLSAGTPHSAGCYWGCHEWCVPCTGPDCKPPKLQLGKISPGTVFVHYTPIFIANSVLKYRLSNRFTILFYFILFCFPECNFYLLFNQVLSLAGRMRATFMYRKIIVAQRRNKTIRSSWGINSNPH